MVNREKSRGARTLNLGGSGPEVKNVSPQFHMLSPDRREVYDSPAGVVRHIQMKELVLQQS